MGQFAGIKEAAVSKSGQYFKAGSYTVDLKEVKMQESTATPGKQFFIIETMVKESSNPDVPTGNERSQVITMGQQMSLPNVKAFMAAVSGVDPNSDDINEQVEAYWAEKLGGQHMGFDDICELVVGPANPLAGLEMKLVCEEITTKATKQPFTKHLWLPRDVTA